MRADSIGARLVLFLLVRLRGSRTIAARCPCPDGAQPEPRVPLARERSLGVLPQLLGVGEVADAGVELAQELFSLGVDLLFLSVGEVP